GNLPLTLHNKKFARVQQTISTLPWSAGGERPIRPAPSLAGRSSRSAQSPCNRQVDRVRLCVVICCQLGLCKRSAEKATLIFRHLRCATRETLWRKRAESESFTRVGENQSARAQSLG